MGSSVAVAGTGNRIATQNGGIFFCNQASGIAKVIRMGAMIDRASTASGPLPCCESAIVEGTWWRMHISRGRIRYNAVSGITRSGIARL